MILFIRMKRVQRVLCYVLVITMLLGFAPDVYRGLAADGNTGENPSRQTTLVVNYTAYTWWVIRWSDNFILCQLITDHEGLPKGSEILKSCGQDVYDLWRATPACQLTGDAGFAPASCSGVYLYKVSQQPAQKTIAVDLPSPTVYVNLKGCNPSPENLCHHIPSLLLTGEEPLPNEHITAIHALVSGLPYNCSASTCEIPLQATPFDGITVEFWADSSFGDSTLRFTAQVRVIDSGIASNPAQSGWFVDVLSSQWRGKKTASCEKTWGTFPPVGGSPTWLTTPDVPELLASEQPYFFLAGRLISQGVVNASDCPGGGILPNGYADSCGLEKALPVVQSWQNQFDVRIIDVARKTGVPAQLMKNLFAQESQFWPGMFNTDHIGLGHLTENGAETILLWNPSFYEQFCPLILDASVCSKGYVSLTDNEQAMLRGALALQAKSDCQDCPAGIDLSNTNFSIDLFARTLVANCQQVAQEVHNATNQSAGSVSSYEDLWKFTVANYHAGPGCLSYGLYSAWQAGDPMDWAHVSSYLTPPCQGVIYYVDQIAK